jgi:hypothetical protein
MAQELSAAYRKLVGCHVLNPVVQGGGSGGWGKGDVGQLSEDDEVVTKEEDEVDGEAGVAKNESCRTSNKKKR